MNCPLDGLKLPARRTTTTRSTGRNCPLDESARSRRDGSARDSGMAVGPSCGNALPRDFSPIATCEQLLGEFPGPDSVTPATA
jgi:hypothetical protein